MSRPMITTAVDAVARELREMILAGDPAPGDRLVEESLAARFEVARHTIRAALRALASERLVVIAPHRGARVARLEGDDLRALFELRAALEVEAARLLARRGEDAARLPEVRAAAARLFSLCESPRSDALRAEIDEAHLALHHALVSAAGSRRITEAHAALATEQRLVLLQSRPALDPGRMAAHHRQLLAELDRTGPSALRHHLADGQAFSTPAAPLDRQPGPPDRPPLATSRNRATDRTQ